MTGVTAGCCTDLSLMIIAVVQPTPLYAGNDILLEDDKPVLPGLPIRAATLPVLTRLVVNVFSK
jgi:hypothetical protein